MYSHQFFAASPGMEGGLSCTDKPHHLCPSTGELKALALLCHVCVWSSHRTQVERRPGSSPRQFWQHFACQARLKTVRVTTAYYTTLPGSSFRWRGATHTIADCAVDHLWRGMGLASCSTSGTSGTFSIATTPALNSFTSYHPQNKNFF